MSKKALRAIAFSVYCPAGTVGTPTVVSAEPDYAQQAYWEYQKEQRLKRSGAAQSCFFVCLFGKSWL